MNFVPQLIRRGLKEKPQMIIMIGLFGELLNIIMKRHWFKTTENKNQIFEILISEN